MSDRPDSDSDSDREQHSSTQVKIAVITGVFAVAAAIITGVFALIAKSDDRPEADTPATTSAAAGPSTSPPPAAPATTTPSAIDPISPSPGTPFQLAATRTDDPLHVSVTATRHRPPRAGYSYWLVMRVHDVNGHSEYYPRKDLTSADTSESFTLDIPPDATVSPRSAQVYEVSRSDATWMTEALDDPGRISPKHLLNPPCGGSCSVSNIVQLPFKQ